MNTLLSTLPGDIDGLLQRGSSLVRVDGLRGLVGRVPDAQRPFWRIHWDGNVTELPTQITTTIALDLTDATSRTHAAWWARSRDRLTSPFCQQERDMLYLLIDIAVEGKDMTPTQIDTLARLVLRLAGREAP